MRSESHEPASPVAKSSKCTPVAIIGIGCLFPKADGVGAYWANIKNGVDAVDDVPASHWNVDDYLDPDPKSPDRTYAARGGFLQAVDFHPLDFGIAPKDIEATDTSQLLGMMVARRALDDAGYTTSREFDRSRVSVVMGVTGTLELVIPLGARLGHPIWRKALKDSGVDDRTAEEVVSRISDSYVGWQENSFPGLLGNVVAGRIANRLDLHGTNCVVDAACASSLSALHLASLELSAGRSDMVVTGGIDTFNDIFMYMCFSKTPALSKTGNARPFDADGDGTILGEGLGVLVLKRLADARRDRDRVYAVIRGIGTSSDGKGNAVYAPSAVGQMRALNDAYSLADVGPDTVELVEAHGTGTKVGDATEINALSQVFSQTGGQGTWCAVGSVKSQIGHTKAAAGVAGVIKAALALHHKVLPPTIKIDRPIDALADAGGPLYVSTERRPWLPQSRHPRRAAVSAFGFGGSNFHCVLEEHGSEKADVDWDGDVQLVALGAPTASALRSRLDEWDGCQTWEDFRRRAGRCRKEFDHRAPCRLVMVVEKEKFEQAPPFETVKRMLDGDSKDEWSTPDGAYYSRRARPGKLGMVFPGQGAQYVGMFRDLACSFPEMQRVLAEANRSYHESPAEPALRLTDFIYPVPRFSEEARAADEASLRATDVAQPAIGAVSMGAVFVLGRFGVQPDAVAGHSFGELTALCAAGRFDSPALHEVSKLRGRLMASEQKDRGAMLAVKAPLADVEAVLREANLKVVIANKNAPNQSVLSGATAEIQRAAEEFKQRQIRCDELKVSAAFHSSHVADAQYPFHAALEQVPFHQTAVPVFSNTTASTYPENPHQARDLLASQLAQPVEFVSEIAAMYEQGVRTFVEVGPGARITGLVRSILKGNPHAALSLDGSSGKRSGMIDLARTLAQLAALGHAVNLDRWDPIDEMEPAPPAKKKLAIKLTGANLYVAKSRPPVERSPAMKLTVAPKIDAAEAGRDEKVLREDPHPNPLPEGEGVRSVEGARRDPRSEDVGSTDDNRPAVGAREENGEGLTQPEVTAEVVSHGLQKHEEGVSSVADARSPSMSETPVSAPSEPAGKAARDEQRPVPEEPLLLRSALTGSAQEAFQVTQRNVLALQKMQQQTATIHQQFLQGQQTAQQTIKQLLDNQRALIEGTALAPSAPDAGAAAHHRTAQPIVFPVSTSHDAHLVSAPGSKQAVASPIEPTASPAEPDAPPTETKTWNAPSNPTASPTETAGPDQLLPPLPLGEGRGEGLSDGKTSPVSAVPQAPPAATRNQQSDAVQRVLLEVVAEKTGYPVEMLEPQMSLDANLGIDSIKRVEILSGLQEQLPELPAVKPEDLGSLETLQQIIDLLTQSTIPNADDTGLSSMSPLAPPLPPGEGGGEGLPESRTAAVSANEPQVVEDRVPEPLAQQGDNSDNVRRVLLDVVAEKTGYPAEMLDLDMGLDTDLGIDSIKRVEILSGLQEQLPRMPAVQPDQLGALQTLRQIVDLVSATLCADVGARPESPPEPIDPAAKTGPSLHARLQEVLLCVVAEKTGYPVEMLEPQMSLDADLGIDSIKRVEILSALQEQLPDLPAVQPEQLGEMQTLHDVASLLAGGDSLHELGPNGAAPTTVSPSPASSNRRQELEELLLEVVAEKTGYPAEMIEFDMGLDTDLGIDSIKRVEILSAMQERLPEMPAVTPEQLGQLQTLRQVVDAMLANTSPSTDATPAPVNEIRRPVAADEMLQRLIPVCRPLDLGGSGPGVAVPAQTPILITDDGAGLANAVEFQLVQRGLDSKIVSLADCQTEDVSTPLAGLVVLSPPNASTDDLKRAFQWAQRCQPSFVTGASVFATVSRMDGRFGLEGLQPGANAVSGGLAGLAKTAAHEWTGTHCKAIDLSAAVGDLDAAARQIVDSLFAQGPVEVGIGNEGRVEVVLSEQTTTNGNALTATTLNAQDVVVVTGGARGVTAETVVALAKASQPTIVLLGRSAPPETEPAWLTDCDSEADVKRALAQNAASPLTPKELEQQYQRITAHREITETLRRLQAAGSTAVYRSVDVRDSRAVGSMLHEIRRSHGPIHGFIHGAGVIADRLIQDKTQEQFDRVFDTKVMGAQTFLEGLAADELRLLVFFSSSTARYGRRGQVDYAVANEVLNKLAQREAVRRPACRVVSFNWGPWDGGMVTPTLRKIFESEGVGVIPVDAGASLLVSEAVNSGGPTEIVVLGPSPKGSVPANVASAASAPSSVGSELPIAFERLLDVSSSLVLASHVIDGRVVMPVALMIEWLGHAAIHSNPGFTFCGLDSLRVLRGVRFDGREPYPVRIGAGKLVQTEDGFGVPVELTSVNGDRRTVHAQARVILGDCLPAADPPTSIEPEGQFPHSLSDVYGQMLFHGPALRGLESIDACDRTGIRAAARTAPPPNQWIDQPLRGSWLTDPLALDCAFQAMIVWSTTQRGKPSLPMYLGRYRQFVRRFPSDRVQVSATVTRSSEHKVVARIEFADSRNRPLARIDDYECVLDAALAEAFRNNQLAQTLIAKAR